MSSPYDCARLVPSPWADLFDHPEEHIAALAEDIKLRGIQTPLQVYPLDSNRTRAELLTGHDRLEAAKRLGLKQVPVEFRSTLTDEDARFRHFIADNTQRKGVDKRRIARAVLLRAKGDISNREVARLVRCDDHTAGDVRSELIATAEIPQLEKTTGADGKARTTTPKVPRAPKVADLTKFRDRPKKADRSEQLREAREQQAPAASPYFEEPVTVAGPAAPTPGGNADAMAREARLDREMRADAKSEPEPVTLSARMVARAEAEVAVQEQRATNEGRITAYVRALPPLPELDIDDIGPRGVAPGYAAEMRAHIAFMSSVLDRVGLRVIA